jgi:hypothetical protein
MRQKSSPKARRGLPPHIAEDPAMLDWRLSTVEERLERLETEKPHPLQLPADFPWLRALGLLFLLVMGVKGHIAPDQAMALAGKLLGVVLPSW